MATTQGVDGRLFNTFRVFVIPAAGQQTLQFTEITKEQALLDVFKDFSSRKNTSLSNKYKLYSVPQKDDSRSILKYQLGKAGKKTLHKEEAERPVAYKALDLKLVDIVYSWERQILFINKSSAYTDFEITDALRNYLQARLRKLGLVVNIDALPYVVDFWRIMNNTRQVYELSLEFNQLNINEGDAKFREVLRTLKDASNDDSLTLQLKNHLGFLSVNNPTIKNVIEYVSEVGGKFRAKYKELGTRKRVTYDSNDRIKYVRIDKPIEDIDDDIVKNRLDNLKT